VVVAVSQAWALGFGYQRIAPGAAAQPAAIRAIAWQRDYARRVMVGDAVACLSVVLVAQFLRFGIGEHSMAIALAGSRVLYVDYYIVSVMVIVAWLIALSLGHTRDARVIGIGADEYSRVAGATITLFGIIALICLTCRADLARLYIFVAMFGGIVILEAERWVLRAWLTRQRGHQAYMHRVALIGYAQTFEPVMNDIAGHPATGFDVACTVALDERPDWADAQDAVPCLTVSSADDLITVVDAFDVDTVIYTGGGPSDPEQLREFGWQLQRRAMSLAMAPATIDLLGPRTHMRRMAGMPLVFVEYPELSFGQQAIKRLVDVVGSVLGLVLLSPLFAVLAIAIKRSSPGPVFFRQRRVGLGGKLFSMFKFRSMVDGAEAQVDALKTQSDGNMVLFKMREDPRVTPVGRWLRKYSLDELPQLINVLRGEMALVGPRPPLESEVAKYTGRDRRRLLVKPGMTGLWQINGRSTLSWDDSIRLDLFYVENWSVVMDAMIMARTVRAVLMHNGAY